ncbi:MAG: Tim44 domain-containing protein [Burkholderiales bacterium]|nr:Tim44 domain-containing protein [Burkholderiales bacterium]
MKNVVLAVSVAVLSASFMAGPVEARRLGGGSSSGMRRQMPARPAPTAPPAQQAPAQPAVTPGGTPAMPAAAPKRNWLGPIAGIAAGVGIAALMSHLGMGAAMGNLLTMLLLGVLAVVVVRFIMQRFASSGAAGNAAPQPQGMQYAGAGTGGSSGGFSSAPQAAAPVAASSILSGPSFASVAAGTAPSLPAGFDAPAFERLAKLIFIRMQAANDKADLDDLRKFSTPEMFAVFKLDLQDRKGAEQLTDVVQLDAQVLDFADEAERQIVSVRFHGLIREEKDAPTAVFDEVWHLVKPNTGSGEWAIAGISQSE